MRSSLCCKQCGKAYKPKCTQKPDLCQQEEENENSSVDDASS